MNHDEFIQHWNYFCSLASKLDNTKDYIYHGINEEEHDEINLIHQDVYSDVFKQIILLTASEFEIMAKYLGNTVESVTAQANIVRISKVILDHYPKIRETEVITPFWLNKPLRNWDIVVNTKANKEKQEIVIGIEWWDAYNDIKHNNEESYKKATLKNAVISLASLFVINLYCMYLFDNDLSILYEYPSKYFKCKYAPQDVLAAFGELPDFGNKSAAEKYQEMLDNLI